MTQGMPDASISAATGLYTASEVEQRTGVPATTLRQWERRYGTPRPLRNESGYRLYSATDLAHIEFLRARLAEGISISRAVQLSRGFFQAPSGDPPAPAELRELITELRASLLAADHARAAELLSWAHSRWTVEDVLIQVIQPVLYDIGDLWARGEITVAHEHQASTFLRGKIAQLLDAAGSPRWGPVVVAACVPGEQHEIGLLMLSVVLRRGGLRVHCLGPNTPLADLALYAGQVGAEAVLLSANSQEALDGLPSQQTALDSVGLPLFFGGASFNACPAQAGALGGHYLGPDAVSASRRLHEFFEERDRS
ncbi:MerR family transcriptional regulator [Deinococcus peraridilitoris]|nr:B12-binding domain-containing protein [Deinococcus peraridilitoris]